MKKNTFDTLSQSQDLQQNGFSTDQANAMTRMMVNALDAYHNDLMDTLTQNFATKQELSALKTEMQTGFTTLDKKIDTKINELDYKILKMTISLAAAMMGWTSLLKWIG